MYLEIQKFVVVVRKQTPSEAPLTQKVSELGFSSRRDVCPEHFPSLLPMLDCVFQVLHKVSFGPNDWYMNHIYLHERAEFVNLSPRLHVRSMRAFRFISNFFP